MPLTRKGFGLVELVVATALTGVLAALTAGVLVRAAAQLREESERIAAQHALRVASDAVRAVLEPAQATGSDLSLAGPTGFVARVVRGAGVVCEWTGREAVVRRGIAWWRAVREPVAGRDSVLIGRTDEPGWIAAPLRAAPWAARCPDGSPALALPVAFDTVAAGRVGPGSPVRLFEPVEVRVYASSGSEWIGMRLLATGEAIQPLAGPLARGQASFEYLTRDGRLAASPREVGAVAFRVAAARARAVPPNPAEGFVLLKGGGAGSW